jgi:hypothetical protein
MKTIGYSMQSSGLDELKAVPTQNLWVAKKMDRGTAVR